MRACPLSISMLAATTATLGACSNAANPAADAITRFDGNTGGPDGSVPTTDANNRTVDAGPLRLLVINEVAAGDDPDWFEIVNATTAAVQLSDFIYVDSEGDFAKAATFPAMMLGPGAYYAQDVDDATAGFKLGAAESLWVYRGSDHALMDDVAWTDGQSPAGGSYARIPDIFGPFQTTMTPTKGAPNQP